MGRGFFWLYGMGVSQCRWDKMLKRFLLKLLALHVAMLCVLVLPRYEVQYRVFSNEKVYGQSEGLRQKPNLVLISVDDLNDWVGCLNGHPQAYTPHLDQLAKQGVLFSNAHCTATACNPSRAAIFSGRWPWKTGVWSNRSPRLFTQYPDITVLPRVLSENGYKTWGCGKLMHSSAAANRLMFDVSFNPEQRWSPFTKESVRYSADEQMTKGTNNPKHIAQIDGVGPIRLPLNRMPSDRKPQTNDGESFDWGALPVTDEAMGDWEITDWAIKKLDEMTSDQPFMLGVGYYRPHIPLFAPKHYFARFEGLSVALPPFRSDDLDDVSAAARNLAIAPETAGAHSTVVEFRQWQEAVKAYLACTTFVDQQIGRLVKALHRKGLYENTVIVIFSDHGWHLGEKQHWGKWTGWERSTRVPLVVISPDSNRHGRFAKDEHCKVPVNLLDLFPTICELCGIPPLEYLDGESLVPLLLDPSGEDQERYSLSTFGEGNYSLRGSRYRYIRYHSGQEELYEIATDPNEWRNLAGSRENQAVVDSLRKHLERILSDSNEKVLQRD